MVDAAASLLEIKNTASEAVRGYTFITDWLAGEFGIANRDITEFVCQTSQTDAHRRWKRMVTRHQRLRNMMKHLQPIRLQSRSVRPP